MDRNSYYKKLFIIAACYNIGAGLPLIIASLFTTALFPLFGMEPPNAYIWFYVSFICIVIFGGGYYWVSRDITKNHSLVVTGGLAKVAYFFLTLLTLINGEANFMLFLTGVGDLIFVGLFIEFLLHMKRK